MSYSKLSPADLKARALAAFEAGFKTLTAKKDAMADLSRAFDMMRNAIQERVLDASGPERKMTPAQEDLYWNLPNTLNNWRPKHAALVLKVFPEIRQGVAEIDKLFELRAKINAAEVAPKEPTKKEREQAIRLSATGALYEREFGKLKPEVAADVVNYHVGQFEQFHKRFGDEMVNKLSVSGYNPKLAEGVSHRDVEQYRQAVQPFLTGESITTRVGQRTKPQLDMARLKREADKYAEHQIAQFVIKLTQKLGDLSSVTIKRADVHGFQFDIHGTLRGHNVSVTQSRKFVVNQHGTAFHQWPALIYVDGKATTEAAFKRLASGA